MPERIEGSLVKKEVSRNLGGFEVRYTSTGPLYIPSDYDGAGDVSFWDGQRAWGVKKSEMKGFCEAFLKDMDSDVSLS